MIKNFKPLGCINDHIVVHLSAKVNKKVVLYMSEYTLLEMGGVIGG